MHDLVVVDNEPDICGILKSSFEDTGEYRVHAFQAAEPALAFMSEARPNLAVLDILLPPPLSGLDLAKRAATLTIPVLLISGHPDYVSGLRPVEFPIVVKPFRMSSFISKVDLLLAETAKLQAQWAGNVALSRRLRNRSGAPLTAVEWADVWRQLCERTFDETGESIQQQL